MYGVIPFTIAVEKKSVDMRWLGDSLGTWEAQKVVFRNPSEKYEFVNGKDHSQLFLESQNKFHGSSQHQADCHAVSVPSVPCFCFLNQDKSG